MTLGDLIALQRGFDLTEGERQAGSVPVIGSAGPNGFHNEARAKAPGITIGRSGGSFGKVTFVRDDFWPHNTTLFVTNFRGNNPTFVRYLLETLDFSALNSGSAQQSLNRNYLYGVRVPKFSPSTQDKIAAVLGAYDDLIEANRRRIALLEQMAEEIYREWFVRLRFPGHAKTKITKGLPAGWTRVKLPELAEITYGFPFDGSRFNTAGLGKPIIRIRNIPDSATTDFTDEEAAEKYIVRSGDLVIGMDGEFHINRWHGPEAYLVQRVCRLKAKQPSLEGYLGHVVRGPIKHYESILMGATVGHLGAMHLKAVEILRPPDALLHELDIFNTLDRQRGLIAQQNAALQRTRDLLLPRLISGKLSVEALDIAFPPSMADK